MRVLFVLCIGIALIATQARADEILSEELKVNSINAVEVFRNSCFANFSDRTKAQEFLNTTYHKLDDKAKVEFLKFVHASNGGDAWTVPPKNKHTVVSEANGNCHVISHDVVAETLHKEAKNLALDVKDSLTFSVVDYKGPTKGSNPMMARFDVKAPDGSVFFIITAVTKETDEKVDDVTTAESVISIFAPADAPAGMDVRR